MGPISFFTLFPLCHSISYLSMQSQLLPISRIVIVSVTYNIRLLPLCETCSHFSYIRFVSPQLVISTKGPWLLSVRHIHFSDFRFTSFRFFKLLPSYILLCICWSSHPRKKATTTITTIITKPNLNPNPNLKKSNLPRIIQVLISLCQYFGFKKKSYTSYSQEARTLYEKPKYLPS